MISSGVTSLGGAVSSAPSWAAAGKAVSPQARSVRQYSKFRIADFMNSSLSLCRQNGSQALPGTHFTGGNSPGAASSIAQTAAATLPPTPFRSPRPEARDAATLPFSWMLPCQKGVAGYWFFAVAPASPPALPNPATLFGLP